MKAQTLSMKTQYAWLKSAKPLDYSFKGLKTVDGGSIIFFNGELKNEEKPLSTRVQGIPRINKRTNRYLTGSFWLNNNYLIHVNGLRKLAERLLESADHLSWLDLSNNKLIAVNPEILLFPNLTVLYMHNNRIFDLVEVYKLCKLKNLLTLTLSGNPVEATTDYRQIVVYMLPTLRKLDNSPVLRSERKPLGIPYSKCIRNRLLTEYPEDFKWIPLPPAPRPPPPSLITNRSPQNSNKSVIVNFI
ncbi:leucine-rich repeat-containing protein 51-like [Daktulosphaira vitifoliae]|uniref:leucine-rich repeat-containing protein 51-like n=1 Tax=Daktulosphaira vitifoliae TaxID=58002 RepID=UPI0021A98141|nr:leucine-rich repeat-containing protein 51-like [Daktulosphaira vitifoliae]